jgi:Alpha/beta hydrolase domain
MKARVRAQSARIALVVTMVACGVSLAPAPIQAKVTKLTITSRESPTYSGQSFGAVGQFEKIIGTATGEIDPTDPRNAVITDIQLAPRNANGKVSYVATFTLIKPLDLSKGNHVLFYNEVNRGSRNTPYSIGGDPGDGFMQNRGYTLLWSGWQGDVAPAANNGNETVQVPVAKNADGSPVTGPVIFRFWNEPAGTTTVTLTTIPPGAFTNNVYQPLSLDTTQAHLETHSAESPNGVTGIVTAIASTDWAWADCRTVPFPGTPDPTRVCLKNGVDPTLLYQLVYTGKDPLVLGVGLAAERDVMSFFRYESADASGTANPVAGAMSYVIAEGTSQAGNALKTFVHLGFNQDESNRKVIDGMNDYIAARQTPVNFRFAFPGGAATLTEPGSEPVLWWEDYTDVARGRTTAGMLDRCRASNTCPKIVESFGSTEFWDLRMSPGLIGTQANLDISLPPEVRRYFHPGTTHGGGGGGFILPGGSGGACVLSPNPNPETETQRALFVDLTDWVTKGIDMPPSTYPKLGDGTLVPANKTAMGFPSGIPGIPNDAPNGIVNSMNDYDFGSTFIYNDMSGVISVEPPRVKQVIPTYVVKTNADGNETAGVRSVLHQLPLGSYLGWNVTASGFFKDQICAFTGGYVPFAKTLAERLATGDPRPSIQERYTTVGNYYFAASKIAKQLIAQRFLLPDDGARITTQALQQMTASGLLPLQ